MIKDTNREQVIQKLINASITYWSRVQFLETTDLEAENAISLGADVDEAYKDLVTVTQLAELYCYKQTAKLVYVAGPYTNPDPIVNTRLAIDMWYKLYQKGYIGVIPHTTMLLHLIYPHDIEHWYKYDIEIMKRCDCVLRLPGKSTGADKEEETAKKLKIPVYHDIDDIERLDGISEPFEGTVNCEKISNKMKGPWRTLGSILDDPNRGGHWWESDGNLDYLFFPLSPEIGFFACKDITQPLKAYVTSLNYTHFNTKWRLAK